MDRVITSALGRQADWSGEDIREFIQEEVQKLTGGPGTPRHRTRLLERHSDMV